MSEVIEVIQIPKDHGDATEYQTVRGGGAGLIDLSGRGRFSLSGSEAVPFLNGLITNDVKALEPGSWMTAVFPNVQGRMLAAVRILNQGKDFLIDTEPETHAKVLQLLQRFTLAGDFHVTDVTSESALISVQGGAAASVIESVLGAAAAAVERQQVVNAQTVAGVPVSIIRATHTGEDGFDLFIAADQFQTLWDALSAAGTRPIGPEALEILRIEAGVPRYGIDMDETSIVSETNLDEAVSFTKGCYIGQEIIARIKYRGHVAKKLAGLVFDSKFELKPGTKISAAGKDVGRTTSVIDSPSLNRTIAMGYVKYDFLAPGTSVFVEENGIEHTAHVADLPFVRGSWY